MGDNNTQKIMTYNETRLTVAITDLIISEGISSNLSQKPRFKKVLNLAINVSKSYQPPNRNMISKYLLDVIHDHTMERSLSSVKKIRPFWIMIFRWRCHYFQNSTIEHIGFRKNPPVAVSEIFNFQGHLVDGGEKDGSFICTWFLEKI